MLVLCSGNWLFTALVQNIFSGSGAEQLERVAVTHGSDIIMGDTCVLAAWGCKRRCSSSFGIEVGCNADGGCALMGAIQMAALFGTLRRCDYWS